MKPSLNLLDSRKRETPYKYQELQHPIATGVENHD
jgi:hypothetical protein